jgi:hypothetical protein
MRTYVRSDCYFLGYFPVKFSPLFMGHMLPAYDSDIGLFRVMGPDACDRKERRNVSYNAGPFDHF